MLPELFFKRNLNVILISIDALRPDYLSCYGYKTNTSPNIDRLSKGGVLFTHAISHASWTCPALPSIITATYPSTHGVNFWDQTLPPSIITLPQILTQNSYHTCFISGHGGLSYSNLGFGTFKDSSSDAMQITEEAIKWLANNQDKKFFLWLHYMDTHDKSLKIPEEKHFMQNIEKGDIESYTLKYEQAISYVDTQIGYLLSNIKKYGLHKNTLAIVTSDHGEEICEHDFCFNHGGFLWDTIIRVPLIMSCAGLIPKNKIVQSQVRHIDLLPTICAILNIKKPESSEGESLLPLIQKNKFHSLNAFSEHKENEGDLSTGKWVFTKFSIRTPEWKLIKTIHGDKEGYELFNLKNDPQESKNLIEIEKEQFNLLQMELSEWMRRQKPNVSSLPKQLNEETKSRLRSLGYLQ